MVLARRWTASIILNNKIFVIGNFVEISNLYHNYLITTRDLFQVELVAEEEPMKKG